MVIVTRTKKLLVRRQVRILPTP